jgi:hypothetical protein
MDMHPSDTGRAHAADPEELRLLADQLTRMRAMLFNYSERFFERIRTYLLLCIALLVVSRMEPFEGAVIFVPFLVPLAFLETGYLFFHTVFARRHAEYLEKAINACFGRDVLVAHRLEAAYFYPPDAPKVAGISLGNPLGMMSAMTLGYTVGGALLWLAGMALSLLVLDLNGDYVVLGIALDPLVMPAALLWTIAIAGHLLFAFLSRRDEKPLLAELERSYGLLIDPPA